MDNFLGLIQHNDTHKPVPHKHTEVIYDHNLSHSAEQCIAGLALSNANYDQAICLLRERYGDEEHIVDVDAYMKNIDVDPNAENANDDITLRFVMTIRRSPKNRC